MDTTTATTAKANLWNGGQSPFKVSYGKLMMWIFLLSDAFTFSALLISYGIGAMKLKSCFVKKA